MKQQYAVIVLFVVAGTDSGYNGSYDSVPTAMINYGHSFLKNLSFVS